MAQNNLLLQKRLELYLLNKHIFVVIFALCAATKLHVLCQKLHFVSLQVRACTRDHPLENGVFVYLPMQSNVNC